MTIFDTLKSFFVGKDEEETGPKLIKPAMNIGTVPIESPLVPMKSRVDAPQPGFDLQATSITRFQQNTFNPYAYSTFRGLFNYTEPSFYRDYDESYRQNPFTSMVVEYLMHEVFANDYHFEGPGGKVVEAFFQLDNTREKIKISTREMFKKGNGFMDKTKKGNKLIKTRVLHTDYITIDFDPKTGDRIYKQTGAPGVPVAGGGTGSMITLKPDFLIHYMLKEEVGIQYGVSLLRNNLVFLTALMDVGGDIMAALKRVAYAPIVANLDLDWLADEKKKEDYITAYKKNLTEVQSATNNFVVDKRHKLELLGSGAAGARLLPTNQMIEPILSVVLINFGVPLGIFIQTGANKSIIEEQRAAMQRFYEDIRNRIKYYVETKIIPDITGHGTTLVWNKPPITSPEVQAAMSIHIKAFEDGLLSREWILENWDIEDHGTSFAAPPLSMKKTKKPENVKAVVEDENEDSEG